MVNDNKIKAVMQDMVKKADEYIAEVTELNPTAYSDSIIEDVLVCAKELEELYKANK